MKDFKQIFFQTLFLVILLITSPAGYSTIELKEFDSPEQEALYRKLIAELRCLVCQNQNLADSNAELAVDLRRQTYEMIRDGSDKQQVIDYMVERYGEFVLYRPPFTASTLLLWLGPFIILVAGILILIRIIRGRKALQPQTLSADEQEKVRALLREESGK
ncbi:MAG: cytochrome c-type biogenesis protein CcmH [Gammaproteobacteria bacterium]|nr:cytochrome c-type biogenesis protein CcmH [Gammaproteobacteria bacterium]